MTEPTDHTPAESSSTESAADGSMPVPGWYPVEGRAEPMYWNGTQWIENAPQVTPQSAFAPPNPSYNRSTTPVDDDERRRILADQIHSYIAVGARLEYRDDFKAILIQGQPVNHILHGVITLLTCGLWLIVWIILLLTNQEKRNLISVDEFGNVTMQQFSSSF